MATRIYKPRKTKAKRSAITVMQRMFVEQLLANDSFNITRAARAAGYKNPSVAGNRCLSDPAVAALLGKAIQERIERCQLSADDVIQHVTTALFLDPLELFERTPEGSFLVRSLDEIPVHVRRCIAKLKVKTRSRDDYTETYIEIDLMSKDALVPIVMKHLGLLGPDGSTTNVNVGLDILEQILQKAEEDRRIIDAKFIEASNV